ncbi:MAG: AAA family ATPase, partial [Thermoplasmata archaeon]
MTERNIFDEFLHIKPLFKRDKDIFGPSYIPDKLLHREKQIEQIASILVTALRGGKPSNILIFGKTGTGKTAVMNYIGHELEKITGKDFAKVHIIYMNCEVVDTHYGVLANIGNNFITDWDARIPFTGWPTEKVYKQLTDAIDKKGGICIIVLDEIDKLVYKTGDDVLYHLTKVNEDLKNAKVSIVGISN